MAIGSGKLFWAPLVPLAFDPFVVEPFVVDPFVVDPLVVDPFVVPFPLTLFAPECEPAASFVALLPLAAPFWDLLEEGSDGAVGVRTRGSWNSPFTGTALGAMAEKGSRQERERN